MTKNRWVLSERCIFCGLIETKVVESQARSLLMNRYMITGPHHCENSRKWLASLIEYFENLAYQMNRE